MNPESNKWNIPPPPGTEDMPLEETNDDAADRSEKEMSIEKEDETGEVNPPGRIIDLINPYLKNPEYIEYEKRHLDRRCRSKSRSHSRERYKKRRSRSRSRSRGRYRRSRSRSHRRRRRHSSSRSRSRSPSYRRRKYNRKRRYSRSRSRSFSRSHYKSSKSKHRKSPRRSSEERDPEVDTELNTSIEDSSKDNVFKNDGTFLEMFKKMQEQQKKAEEPPPAEASKPIPIFGKRRGGKVLKTGLVQKPKPLDVKESSSNDAWSMYMSEVRKYKEACCDDDSKTRPLVK